MRMTFRHSKRRLAKESRARLLWIFATVITLFTIAPGARTQVPPPGVLVGPTLAASVRNAAAATRDQAGVVAITASTCARNASSANYRIDQFMADFHTMQLQFQALQERFNWLSYLAVQLNRPQAHNALAELGAGLNIISELFAFLDQRFTAGTLDRATHARICRTLEDVMRDWERELRKGVSRMGVAL